MSIRKRSWTTTKGAEKSAWIVDYCDDKGVRRQKTFARQADAKAWRDRTGVQLQEGTHVADRATVTVGRAAELWLESCGSAGLERTTTDAYRSHVTYHIKPLIGSTLLSRISVPAVRAFEDEMRKSGRSLTTIKRVVGSLGSIIADAQERGLAAHNAVREMRGARKGKDRRQQQRHEKPLEIGVDIPTPAEMKAFLAALEGRWRPLLMTAAFTGLRASELRGLRWSDVDLTKRELTVRQRADRFNEVGSPKSRQGRRTVPIPAKLTQILREWKLVCPKADSGKRDVAGEPVKVLEFVFPNGAGKIEGLGNIVRRGLWPAMLAAGVAKPTGKMTADGQPALEAKYKGMHSLRHWYASWCINPTSAGGMGLAPKVVQERMGHASIVMTMDRYGHLFPRGDAASEVDAAERALLG